MKSMVNQNIKISIIVPVYQAEKYLEECINSIKKQTYSNLEVLLIDDGSTDHSAIICDTAAQDDERFIVVHQQNCGVSSARNRGLKMCHGDYIMFVDADDRIEQNCCEECKELISSQQCDICFFEMFISFDDKNVRTASLKQFGSSNGDLELKHRLLVSTIPFQDNGREENMVFYGPYCKMYDRRVIENAMFFEDLKYGEDAIFNFQAILRSEKFCFLDNALYVYRKNPDSATAVFHLDRVEQSILRLEYTYKLVKKVNKKDICDTFGQMFINISYWLLSNIFDESKFACTQTWKMYITLSRNDFMISTWRVMRRHYKKNKLLNYLFSDNTLQILILFIRLYPLKNKLLSMTS